jgi:putative Holliday junction resolvase
MAFDYGQRRIGVAIGDRLTASARGLITLSTRDGDTLERVGDLVTEWGPEAFVIGRPTRDDGAPTALVPAIEAFADRLGRRFGLPVYWADERLTSHLGRERVRKRGNDPGLDAHAAALILEGWFMENPDNA